MEQTARELVLGLVRRRTPPGASVVIEGAPGIGKTFLARRILDSVPPGEAKVLIVAGEQGRRNDPFAAAGQLAGDMPGGRDLGEAAFDRVDELCADGPVVLCADDAHHLDAATLMLLRRLVWASRSLPLAVLVNTRPYPSREPLAMLIGQAQVRLRLPPMGPMMVERLVLRPDRPVARPAVAPHPRAGRGQSAVRGRIAARVPGRGRPDGGGRGRDRGPVRA